MSKFGLDEYWNALSRAHPSDMVNERGILRHRHDLSDDDFRNFLRERWSVSSPNKLAQLDFLDRDGLIEAWLGLMNGYNAYVEAHHIPRKHVTLSQFCYDHKLDHNMSIRLRQAIEILWNDLVADRQKITSCSHDDAVRHVDQTLISSPFAEGEDYTIHSQGAMLVRLELMRLERAPAKSKHGRHGTPLAR